MEWIHVVIVGLDAQRQATMAGAIRMLDRSTHAHYLAGIDDAVEFIDRLGVACAIIFLLDALVPSDRGLQEALVDTFPPLPVAVIDTGASQWLVPELWTDVITMDGSDLVDVVGRTIARASRELRLVDRVRRHSPTLCCMLHTFVEHSPLPCFIVDSHGEYQYVNAAYRSLVRRDSNSPADHDDKDQSQTDALRRIVTHDRATRDNSRTPEFVEPVPHIGGTTLPGVEQFLLPGTDGALAGIVVGNVDNAGERENGCRRHGTSPIVLDSIKANIAVIDRGGNIASINRSWIEYATRRGWVEKDISGTALRDAGTTMEWLGIVSDSPVVEKLWQTAIRDGKPLDVEYCTDDDEWYVLSVVPMNNGEGVVVSRVDITDARRAGMEARRRQSLFRNFMDNSPVLSYAKDANGRHVFVNRRFCEVVGANQSEIIGKTDFELWWKEDADRIQEIDNTVLRTREPFEYRASLTINNERRFWYTAKFVVTDPDTGEEVVAGKSIDITEQVRAEEALRKSEERFQLASNATNDAVWDWDLGTGTIWFSRKVEALFGHTLNNSQTTLEWWREHVHPDEAARVFDGLRQAIDKQQ